MKNIKMALALVGMVIISLWGVNFAEAQSGVFKALSKAAKWGDEAVDVGKAARMTGKTLSATDKAMVVKNIPSLASKSDDMILGFKVVAEFAEQGARQSRLVSDLDNPFKLREPRRIPF